jgi:cyclophilin family peptidyl-prolyl cis-trans isomerase
MSDRAILRYYAGSRAVLIATSTYASFDDVPAANSVRRFRDLLTSDLCGWPQDRITEIQDADGPGDLHAQLIRLFREARDVALFYFVGHGLEDDDGQLCLGLVNSSNDPDLRAATSLPFEAVRDALIRSNAATKLVFLDCCFSGLASRRRNTLSASPELMDQVGGTGAYTMAACAAYGTASFETEGSQRQTHFTKYLADLVERGIPGQPARLRLRTIFDQLSEALRADGHPLPVPRNVDSAADFVFAYNAAPVQAEVDDVPTALRLFAERIERLESSVGGSRQADGAPAAGIAAADSGPDGADVVAVMSRPGGSEPVQSAGAGVGVHRPGSQDQSATLLSRAADLLRLRRGEEFRAVEHELQERGLSARPTAVLTTSMGDISLRLFPDYAPDAVRNFIELAEGRRRWADPRLGRMRADVRLYDGTVFHKVVRDLLIQGGDPLGTGTSGPGYRLQNEFHRDLSFDRPYMVAMASVGEDSSGSQFFITVGLAPWLTRKHTIFGEVVSGAKVADRIGRVRTDKKDRPLEDVVLREVRISGDLTSPG